MVINVPEDGIALETSASFMAELPMQAFAISLSDSMIENMIECVQNGQGIQLSLGADPVSSLVCCAFTTILCTLLCASQ